MGLKDLVRRLLGTRTRVPDLPPAGANSLLPATFEPCPMTVPLGADDFEPMGSTYTFKRPCHVTLADGREVDVLAVATYEVGTNEPLRLHYEPLSFFTPRPEER